jgi:FdhD protein
MVTITEMRSEEITIKKLDNGNISEIRDQVAVEEPLEIQLSWSTANGKMKKNIAVTMRTPGNDKELAAGFLFTEGIIEHIDWIHSIVQSSYNNSVLVTLHENVFPKLNNAERNFYATSSCGICGKASIDAISMQFPFEAKTDTFIVEEKVFYALQDAARLKQAIFKDTGGIHASALFSSSGEIIQVMEDVGRHNALDKLVGYFLLLGKLPLTHSILLLSGRAGFELIQKSVMAGIKIVAAVGAPSSMAVELANEMNITLIGFLRERKFNIYSGAQRIIT